MAKTSKWFVVATEGATTDGRTINRSWIEQMAANYDPKKYGARVNIEHIKFRYLWNDEPHSKCYGDVTALKTEETEDGKLQLLAQIDPTDELIALNKNRQKIYTSIECDPNFADTGEAYLVGLAVTDSPASLCTEMLQFSAHAKANPFADRKERPENLFTAAVETKLEFEDKEPEKPSLFSRITAMFNKKERTDGEPFARTLGTMLAEEFADYAKAAQLAGKDFEVSYLERVAELVKDEDMPDESRARLYRELGLLKMESEPETALATLERALELNKNIGVKGEVKKLRKQLNKPDDDSQHAD